MPESNAKPKDAIATPQSKRSKTRWFGKLWRSLLVLFVFLNGAAYLAAHIATHVRAPGQRSLAPPKPQNPRTPADLGIAYTTHRIPIDRAESPDEYLEAWLIPAQQTPAKGTFLLFHGNLGTKGSQLIAPAETFTALGYDTLLVDFRGVGGSSGNTTTFGVREARDVAVALAYARAQNFRAPIVLYGLSMGSAAILRAIAVEGIDPDAIVLELPFARLVNAVRSRVRYSLLLAFPTTEMLLFWGGLQHGFNGFAHNPVDFARDVRCPALVLHGEKDEWTTVSEIEALFQNLQGPKQLVISPDAAHQQLVGVDRPLWERTIASFLDSL